MDIVMAQHAWDKFRTLTRLADTEIAAFGFCTVQEEEKQDNWLFVDDIFVVPQEVSGTQVDFISDGLPFAVNRANDENRLKDLRFCIHSHCNFGTFFSSTDDEMITTMGEQGIPWFASAVFNKKGETSARIDIFGIESRFPGISHITLGADVLRAADYDLEDECKRDIKEFCSRPAFKSYSGGTGKSNLNGSLKPENKTIVEANTQEEAQELFDEFLKNENWHLAEGQEGTCYFFDEEGDYRGSAPDVWAIEWTDPDALQVIAERIADEENAEVTEVLDRVEVVTGVALAKYDERVAELNDDDDGTSDLTVIAAPDTPTRRAQIEANEQAQALRESAKADAEE